MLPVDRKVNEIITIYYYVVIDLPKPVAIRWPNKMGVFIDLSFVDIYQYLVL